MTFMLTDYMLYAMWVVLGLMGLDFLVGLYKALKTNSMMPSVVLGYLLDTLYYILPLFLLANMAPLDHTDWLLKIAYYIGAVGVAWKYLLDIKKKL
ncbi:hypothetical protein [Paenibacillus sp. HJGM_3]|uniref:hypothetical protein n=1 Tax=Paenibacillus sp. HJGM_3 TaxID=3379816 RepID=UPI00385DE9BA